MLHLSFVAARDRETGETELLEFVSHVSAGGERAAVGALAERLRAADGADLRAQYSDVTVVIDNSVVATYEFPDPAAVERERKQQQLLQARAEHAAATQRETAAVQAAASATAAKGERKAAQARVAELERELGVKPPPAPSVPSPEPLEKLEDGTDERLLEIAAHYQVEITPEITREQLIRAIKTKAGYKSGDPSLADLTVAELKQRCEDLGVDSTGFRLKQEYIDAIELDEKLSELTVAELRAKAIAAGIETAGFKRKREYLDAIEAHEQSKV